MVFDRIPRGGSPAPGTILPSLDPDAVARAGAAQQQAVAAQSSNYQQILYQQALDQQKTQLAQQIQQSRASATLETSYTPNPRSAAAPEIAPPAATGRAITAAAAFGIANTALTAVSLQGIADQAEGFALDRATYLPQSLRDFLRWAPDNNPFNPGNYLHYATDRLSRQLFDRLLPNRSRSNDALQSAQPLTMPLPFYGGQQAGRSYNVSASVTFEFSGPRGPDTRTDSYNWTVTGPITGFQIQRTGSYPSQSDVLNFISGGGTLFVGSFGVDPATGQTGLRSYGINNVVPTDGLPDTGGNPAPAPGTTRPEGQRSANIAPSRTIAPVVTPPRIVPNSPAPAGTPRSIPAPTPPIVPTAAAPISPLHPKNLSPAKSPNPFKSLPDANPNPVAPAGIAELGPTIAAATAPAPITRPVTPEIIAGGGMQPHETVQDYIERLHNEQLQRLRDGSILPFTNPFENLSNNITEQNPATAPATESLNPLIPALGVAGLVGAGAVIARRTIPSGLETSNPTRTGNPAAPVTARPTRTQPQTQPQTPEFPGTGTDTPSLSCRYDGLGISGKVDQTNATLTAFQAWADANILAKVNSIDSKMGSVALPGGVTGTLQTIGNTVTAIQSRVKKTWDFLQIDRILSFLTLITVFHNAYMLSSALTQTLFSAISTMLDATGLDEFLGLVDSDDESFDVQQAVNKLTDNFFKSIFGVENVDGMKSTWKKYNRIYQAATNMLNSIQSMVFSMVEILEVISNYTGKIGNALKESGTILQNSFNWMNPNANYQDGKWFRYLNNIQEFVETVDELGSEVVSIQDTARDLSDQKDEFSKAVDDAEKKVSDDKTKSKIDSTRPLMNIARQDEYKAEGT